MHSGGRLQGRPSKAAIAGLVLVLALSASAAPQAPPKTPPTTAARDESAGIRIHDGFYKGHTVREFSERERAIYAAGIIDGMFLAPLFGAPTGPRELAATRSQWLGQCVEGMSPEQVAAIIAKYLTDHPERWHQDAKESAFSAIVAACPEMPNLKGAR
jgi:hypothetical protein